jgi:hypothetical protein
MSDNEHATAALWNSSVLSVKNSVGEPIPDFPQRPEEGSKCPSSVCRQDTGDVLPNQPSGPQTFSKSNELNCKLATSTVQSSSETSDGKILAWSAANEDVRAGGEVFEFDLREIAIVLYLGIVVS